MAIPDFTHNGTLPPGIHLCSGTEFIDRFCKGEKRESFRKTIINILDFAQNKQARNIFVGGSFVTTKKNPSDIDCLIEFYKDRQIPAFIDCPISEETTIDILYSSAESRNLTDSFITLLSSAKYTVEKVGVIQIDLNYSQEPWQVVFTPDDTEMEIIVRMYSERRIIERINKRGVLVTIHGLYSRAEWNMNVLPVASSQGWIVAPYIYDKNDYNLIFNSTKRREIIERFRNWIYEIRRKYQTNVSVVAHSFGTYIIAKYISEFGSDDCPVTFDSIILLGSIIKSDFNWDLYKGSVVGRVLNMVAPQDEIIKYMPEKEWKRIIGIDQICGRTGRDGFNIDGSVNTILTQKKINILTHTNAIKQDIIDTIIMPFVNVNKGIFEYEEDKIFLMNQKNEQ